jgi:hypothetical protein
VWTNEEVKIVDAILHPTGIRTPTSRSSIVVVVVVVVEDTSSRKR